MSQDITKLQIYLEWHLSLRHFYKGEQKNTGFECSDKSPSEPVSKHSIQLQPVLTFLLYISEP